MPPFDSRQKYDGPPISRWSIDSAATSEKTSIVYGVFGKSEFSKDGLKDSILSNILEALIGAVFIDSSYEITQKMVLNLWNDLINDELLDQNILNPKSELQEITLALKKDLPDYKTVSVDGKDHNPEFTVSLSITGYESIQAKGKTKQDAEKNAATKMLKLIK